MKPPSLLAGILRLQGLVATLSCAIFAAGTIAAAGYLIRRGQDDVLRTIGATLLRGIEKERAEEGSEVPAAAEEVFADSKMEGFRFEISGRDGAVLVSLGGRRLGTLRLGSVAPGECGTADVEGEPPVRVCAFTCGDEEVLRVAEPDALHQPGFQRTVVGVLLALPLAVLAGSLVGQAAIRHRLRPLQQLKEAAARLGPGPDLKLGVGARDAELAGLESSFDDLLTRLEGALERERRFSQEASHELRTPLTILRARIDRVLSRLGDRPDLKAEAEAALAEVGTLERLVESLLLLARSESEPLPDEPVNLCDLARDRVHLQALFDGPGSRAVEVEAPDEIMVHGSEELLSRALGNLVENARKFAGSQGRIRIRVMEDAGRAVLIVEDDGPGIRPEQRPHIFERFFRGSAERVDTPGAGLGLAVARAVVVRHGGGIGSAPSALGGEEFRIVLRLMAAQGRDPTTSR